MKRFTSLPLRVKTQNYYCPPQTKAILIASAKMSGKGAKGLSGKGAKGTMGDKGKAGDKKKPVSRSARAGLQFPVGRIHRLLKVLVTVSRRKASSCAITGLKSRLLLVLTGAILEQVLKRPSLVSYRVLVWSQGVKHLSINFVEVNNGICWTYRGVYLRMGVWEQPPLFTVLPYWVCTPYVYTALFLALFSALAKQYL